ncbi:MAG: hypothetical protein IT226_16410 [Flavobacteriales bacterium]|nr:hypothetical protein [Flavobacteriales bacterium]
MNDPVVQILVAVLPSVVVFLTAFYLLKQVMGERSAERIAAVRKDDHKQVLPLRLQAYERLALFLERIQPGPLVLRLHQGNMDTGDLQQALVSTIREEYEHNVTQQIYVSDKAWSKVKQAKEETIRLVNLSYEQVGEHPSSSELSRRIFENIARLSHTPSQEALVVLKDEVRRMF